MLKSKKIFNTVFILIILVFGSFLSLKVGISHDELHEQLNWEYNLMLIKNILFGSEQYSSYIDKYYGIGFNYLSQPFQSLFLSLSNYSEISQFGFKLILKHPIVFILYFISGLFFYKILKKITQDKNFSKIATVFYLTYPYLLGHSFFNSKDIPFLSLWLICTYLSCNILNKFNKLKKVSLIKVISLALVTSFLISIRISGILIFFQYLITLIIYLNLSSINFEFKKVLIKKLTLFFPLCFLFIYLLYPVFWKNPLEILNAIKFMSQHHNDICTVTFGKCIRSLNLDSNYIYLWLLVKLPIIVIIGLILIPFTEKKIFKSDTNKVFFGTILISIFLIPLTLIFMQVALYDEIRQVVFLVPLFILIGVSSFYFFFKKKSYLVLFLFIGLFIYENVKIFPYQYVWMNYPARIIELENNFEFDYWGISGKNLALKFQELSKEKSCLVSSPTHSVKPFLIKKGFDCFLPWASIQTNIQRPFHAIQLGRNLRTSLPYKCKYIFQERISLLFYEKKLTMGNLIRCN